MIHIPYTNFLVFVLGTPFSEITYTREKIFFVVELMVSDTGTLDFVSKRFGLKDEYGGEIRSASELQYNPVKNRIEYFSSHNLVVRFSSHLFD
jgi:hypothetical protein